MLPSYPVSVKAVVERDGKFLMLKGRRGGVVEWSFPGGLVEEGESLGEALVREVREETGLRAVPGRVFHAEKYTHPRGPENVGVYFTASVSGEPKLSGEHDKDFEALEWLRPADAPDWARRIMARAP
jgi:8-oxo-dGTP pyrophosphatase MutT (NUDIX family)